MPMRNDNNPSLELILAKQMEDYFSQSLYLYIKVGVAIVQTRNNRIFLF